MFRDFIWSEGMGTGNGWLSAVNLGPQPMTVAIEMRMDDGREHSMTYTVAPRKREAWPLSEIAKGSHFWLRARIDQQGCVTLTSWDKQYSLPPYTPPPSIYDEGIATWLKMTSGSPEER